MGLPEININFTSLAASAIQRSQRGIVALILKDDAGAFDSIEYKSVLDIVDADWSAENLQYIKDAFLGVPSKIIVERIAIAALDYNDALIRLGAKRWNYLAIPAIASGDVATVATQLKTWRDTDKKTFKAVLPNNTGDHEGIINFTTEGIVVGANTYTASQYTARIAGILAGLALTRSSTFYVLSEVTAITESITPGVDIDAGQLILINDGEKIKIGRGVNSLTTVSPDKSADWKKIKIIEGMDLIKEDVTRTFNDDYVGKMNNNYNNQFLFITAVNGYLIGLQPDVLDPSIDNSASIDIEAQRTAWTAAGTDVSELTDDEIKEKSFQSKVFLTGKIKISDAVEDLTMKLEV